MRYFHVTYHIKTKNNGWGFGSMGRTEHDKFPSKSSLIRSIEGDDDQILSALILSVTEMNKGDFNDFFDLQNPESEDSTK